MLLHNSKELNEDFGGGSEEDLKKKVRKELGRGVVNLLVSFLLFLR